ncbi:TetR family transcriptional regulator [Streptomyces sp. NBC_01089]|uniref:acyl-CoA-like ligand-binding transcription factor n=1 Tax=Streptomyces sp. NBC_01089 TaxID=2903747 RepID=UPI0038670C68|nr:TetR family transcriptional regulator [Streptomyces sp. NBC_01089]
MTRTQMPTASAQPVPGPSGRRNATPVPGLRERKKLKTRQTIRREAYRLFAGQGYEATTVDRIAEAAEVSPSTFFRYFPTKEDVVLVDEYAPVLAGALESRPADEPVVDAIRHAFTGSLAQLLGADRQELLFRTRLAFAIPAIRVRAADQQLRSQDAVAALIVERTGREPGDLEANCAAAAITAVFSAVVRHWTESGGAGDLAELFDRQLSMLSAGLRI